MSNFDVANLALQVACPGNELLYDDKGMPSVMVKIPKMTWADLGVGTSTETFPAFIVNGQEVDAIYFSKYQNVTQNNRAYSLPGQNPRTNITFDQSCTYSANKGEGWHCTTRLEWMVIAWWCLKNNYQPLGNNNYGRDHTENLYKAIPTSYGSDGKINRVATGTGPVTWAHNNSVDGIWDMNGNVVEWLGGIRLVRGELQIISRDGQTFGNDAADAENSQSVNSSCWYAIDGTTGTLISPNGSGTTSNSLKLDRVSNKWRWITGTITDQVDDYRSGTFGEVSCENTVCEAATRILQALGMLKLDGTEASAYNSDYFYANNGAEERSFCAGGYYTSASRGGVFSANSSIPRSNTSGNIGFRGAFVKLPTA